MAARFFADDEQAVRQKLIDGFDIGYFDMLKSFEHTQYNSAYLMLQELTVSAPRQRRRPRHLQPPAFPTSALQSVKTTEHYQ